MSIVIFFFFNDTATTEIYTLSLHDALPISTSTKNEGGRDRASAARTGFIFFESRSSGPSLPRSEEHTSELQSRSELVCRVLLEKKSLFASGVTTTPLPFAVTA